MTLQRFGSLLALATSYTAAWPLPWPDSHRQVEHTLRTHSDSRSCRGCPPDRPRTRPVLPVHPGGTLVGRDPPVRLPDQLLGNRKRLVLRALACSSRFLPGHRPRLIEWTFLVSRPLRSTATPASSGFPATTGRSASERLDRYSMPPVSAVGTLPLATVGACDPGRRFDARLLTFRARAADQAHAASTPDTTWPERGHPPGSSRGQIAPRFRCHLTSFDASTTTPGPANNPSRTLLERLPGPHLTRSSRAFSLDRSPRRSSANAAPGGLTPTPAGPTPEDRGRDARYQTPPAQIPACASTHWAPPLGSGVKAHVRPGMKDPGLG